MIKNQNNNHFINYKIEIRNKHYNLHIHIILNTINKNQKIIP